MGRPFDAAGDLAGIARDHDQARIGGRAFFGIFQEATADGDPRGGPIFVTAVSNIFDTDLEIDQGHQTTITIRDRAFYIDGRQPDGRGSVRLVLTEQ